MWNFISKVFDWKWLRLVLVMLVNFLLGFKPYWMSLVRTIDTMTSWLPRFSLTYTDLNYEAENEQESKKRKRTLWLLSFFFFAGVRVQLFFCKSRKQTMLPCTKSVQSANTPICTQVHMLILYPADCIDRLIV